jgi:hypothetical protein
MRVKYNKNNIGIVIGKHFNGYYGGTKHLFHRIIKNEIEITWFGEKYKENYDIDRVINNLNCGSWKIIEKCHCYETHFE